MSICCHTSRGGPGARRRLAALALATLAAGAVSLGAAGDNSVRPEIGKPLQAATAFLRKKDFNDARAELHNADAVPNKTPYEAAVIEEMRAAIAADTGDLAGAITAYKAVIASEGVDATVRTKMTQAVAVDYYELKDYADSIAWTDRYFKAGGGESAMHTVLIQSYYLSGDFAAAAGAEQAAIAEEEKAGKVPDESQLQLLASCYFQRKDSAGYMHATEKLVAYYPKKQSWSDLIHSVWSRPGFAADRLALDVDRLRLATGTLSKPDQFMEMTELALEAGLAGEATQVVDKGFASKILGLGADAGRHQRLKDLVTRTAADDQQKLPALAVQAGVSRDGNALVTAGGRYIAFGQYDKGVALMQEGIAKGGLEQPEDAKLHLALAYLAAGMKQQAQRELKTVQGDDGTADLARLWLLYLNAGPSPATI